MCMAPFEQTLLILLCTERVLFGFILFKPEKGNYRPNRLRLTKVYVLPSSFAAVSRKRRTYLRL